MACPVPYIRNTYRGYPELINRLENINTAIWNEIDASKLFETKGNTRLFSRTNTKKFNNQISLVREINKKYGGPIDNSIIKIVPTKTGNKNKVVVSLHPIAEKVWFETDAAKKVASDRLDLAIDEVGESVPEVLSSLQKSELASYDKISDQFDQDISEFNQYVIRSNQADRLENKGEVVDDETAGYLRNSKFSKGYVFELGRPSSVLQAIGMPDLNIEIGAEQFKDHIIADPGHHVKTLSFKGLVKAIQDPIAIWQDPNYKGEDGRLELVTVLRGRDGKNINVVLQLNRTVRNGNQVLNVNSITTAFETETSKRFEASILGDNALYVDKEKITDYLQGFYHFSKIVYPKSISDSSTKIQKVLYKIERFPDILNENQKNFLRSISTKKENRKGSDPSLQQRYFETSNKTTGKEILRKIASENHPLSELAKQLLKYNSNVKIELVDTDSLGLNKISLKSYFNSSSFQYNGDQYSVEQIDGSLLYFKNKEEIPFEEYDTTVGKAADNKTYSTPGQYIPGKNTIQIANRGNFQGGSSIPTILHEIIHSLSYKALRAGNKTARDFNEIYQVALNNKEKFTELYPLSNIDEFITGVFTNSRFINELKNIPATENVDEYESLWDKLLNLFKKWFRLEPNQMSLFDQAFSIGTHVIDENGNATSPVEEGIEVLGAQGADNNLRTPEKIRDNILAKSANIELREVDVKQDDGTVEKQSKYFVNGKMMTNRVSDFVHKKFGQQFKNKNITEDQEKEAFYEFMANRGTAGHQDHEHALTLMIDPKTHKRLSEKEFRENWVNDSSYTPEIGDEGIYSRIVENLWERLNTYDDNAIFLSEVKIFNDTRGTKSSVGGTTDMIILEPVTNEEGETVDTKVNILDWKFVNLNTDKYDDIPWYKREAWNLQMKTYKNILIENYGIKNEQFAHTRMIPIIAEYSNEFDPVTKKRKAQLVNIQLGNVNPESEEFDYLLAVPLKEESTGDKGKDELLSKLNAVYKQIFNKKVPESEKKQKADELNYLFKAIRHLQVKDDATLVLKEGNHILSQARKLIQEFNDNYSEPRDISNREMSDYVTRLMNLYNSLSIFENISTYLSPLYDELEKSEDEKDKELLKTIQTLTLSSNRTIKDLSPVLEKFTSNFIAGKYGVHSLLDPEPVIKSMTKMFNGTATLPTDALQVLAQISNEVKHNSDILADQESDRLEQIRNKYVAWAKSKGLSKKDFFSYIKKGDSNKLIDRFSREFYDTLREKIKSGKVNDIKWIAQNIDIEEFKKWCAKQEEKEIETLKNSGRYIIRESGENDDSAQLEEDINKIKNYYRVVNPKTGAINTKADAWYDYINVRNFPSVKWESDEYKKLQEAGNEPARDLYNYIIDRNQFLAEIGYITNGAARTFLPYVRSGLTERMMLGGKLHLGRDVMEQFSLDEGVTGYGSYNPLTGELENKIPAYFTHKLKDGEVSNDLFANLVLLNHSAIRYQYLNDVEGMVLALQRVEHNKDHLEKWNRRQNRYEDPVKGNEANAAVLDSMIEALIYGKKYVSSSAFDVMMGNPNKALKKANDAFEKIFRFRPLPDKLSDNTQISLMRSLDALNKYFSFLHLNNLNVVSPLSNFFGGTLQNVINSGELFSSTDLLTNYKSLTPGFFHTSENAKKKKLALDYFIFYTEDIQREVRAKKLSYNKLNEQALQHFSGGLLRASDRGVQAATGLALLDNTIVVDGPNGTKKLMNVNKYVKSQDWYKELLTSPQKAKEIKLRAKQETQRLKEEKGFWKVAEIKDGKLHIPGIERNSQDVHHLRTLSMEITQKTLGNMSDAQKRMMDLSVITKSMMVFKNWIPGTVEARTGKLKYNSNTQAYEWGRLVTWWKFGGGNFFRSLRGLIEGFKLTQGGINQIKKMYEQQRILELKNRGRELDMTLEEFSELVTRNLRNQLKDFIAIATTLSLLLLAKSIEPPDPDEDPRVRSSFNFMLRTIDKLSDEASFYYNPVNFTGMLNGSLFPSIGIFSSGFKVATQFTEEIIGLSLQNDELIESAKPTKYLMRSFPFAKQLTDYMPLFLPETAKDLGVRINSSYNRE